MIIVESTALALPYLSQLGPSRVAYPRSFAQSISYSFATFNRPVTNNTEHELDSPYTGSWQIDVTNTLAPSSHDRNAEAELAFAPSAPNENQSIPTIIVQERADGLLRIEYFAQNWPNSYGLLLYNATSPGWTTGTNVTIRFHSTGPPSPVNPQIAPRPNGNVDVLIGGGTVLSEYPIAWADLSDVYLYGAPGSLFMSGTIQISFYTIP